MASRGAKATLGQFALIVDYMEKNPVLAKNKLTQSFTSKDRSDAWEELSCRLNSVVGPKKDSSKWQKTWSDYKYTTRLKASKLKKSTSLTESRAYRDELTELECKVLNLTGWNDDFVDESVCEEGFSDSQVLDSEPSFNIDHNYLPDLLNESSSTISQVALNVDIKPRITEVRSIKKPMISRKRKIMEEDLEIMRNMQVSLKQTDRKMTDVVIFMKQLVSAQNRIADAEMKKANALQKIANCVQKYLDD